MNKPLPLLFILHKSLPIIFSQNKLILTEKSLRNETRAII